jgi:hypothetical protein
MCKRNSKRSRIGKKIIRVDGCLPVLLRLLNDNPSVKTLASCCGHGKYHPSVVARIEGFDFPTEIFSGTFIQRKKRFYVKDKWGFYYIPEALRCMSRKRS